MYLSRFEATWKKVLKINFGIMKQKKNSFI